MDLEASLTIIKILAAAFLAAGGVLISIVSWVVVQAYRQTESIDKKLDEEFSKFGQQLHALQNMVRDEIHRADLRITRLEEWRKSSDRSATD